MNAYNTNDFKIISLLLFTGICSLQCMENYSKEELQAIKIAYTPVPSQTISNLDDVPAMCVQLVVKCYRQSRPNIAKTQEGEIPFLPLTDQDDASIVGKMNYIAEDIKKDIWEVWPAKNYFDPLGNKIIYALKHIPHASDCDIQQLGKTYEKIIGTLKVGWSALPLKTFPGLQLGDTDWYCFVKTRPLFMENELLISLFQKFYLSDKIRCRCTELLAVPVHCLDRKKLYLWIKKDTFSTVQQKLRFHLPSEEELIKQERIRLQTELTLQELSQALPFLEELYENN